MLSLPITAVEFSVLREEGKTVVYKITPSTQTVPDGNGWVLRGEKRVDGNLKEVVWGKIVPLDETGMYYEEE